jgi:hypothetical protein
MSDLAHRAWTRTRREVTCELLIPRAFLAARAASSGPAAPQELSARLDTVGSHPAAGDCVRALWPTDLLQPLADYAENCADCWTGRTWVTAHVAADALAQHARHTFERESA